MYHSPCREKPIAVVKALRVFPEAPSWAMARTEATPYGDMATFLSAEFWASCEKTFRPKSVCLSCREPSPTLLRVSNRKIYTQSILVKKEENRCKFDCGWFRFKQWKRCRKHGNMAFMFSSCIILRKVIASSFTNFSTSTKHKTAIFEEFSGFLAFPLRFFNVHIENVHKNAHILLAFSTLLQRRTTYVGRISSGQNVFFRDEKTVLLKQKWMTLWGNNAHHICLWVHCFCFLLGRNSECAKLLKIAEKL